MNKIEKLDLIIKLYYEGKYSIGTFADVFSETYAHEPNNCDVKLLKKYKNLFEVTSRYSPYETERFACPNVYYYDDDIVKALNEFRLKNPPKLLEEK